MAKNGLAFHKLAKKEDFQKVIDQMKASGYEFLAWVTINSKMTPYYLSSEGCYAQHSRIFFIAPPPRQTLIVMLELIEHVGYQDSNPLEPKWDPDHYTARWRIGIWFSYKRIQAQMKQYNLWYERLGNKEEALEKAVEFGIHDLIKSKEFEYCGSDGLYIEYEQPYAMGSIIQFQEFPLEKMIGQLGKLLKYLKPYLYKKFNQLMVVNFPPVYCFKDSARIFWPEFPLNRLKNVTKEIWGLDINE